MAEGTTDSNGSNMRILIVIPTYEPHYVHDLVLEDFYTQNFDSFLSAQGQLDVKLALTDFASSRSFKAFLKNYACSREGCYFIDGKPEASLHVAYNIALRYFDYDYAVVAQSDIRARDDRWLKTLLSDFDDPSVQVVETTVTDDGDPQYEQNQLGPLDRDSRILRFPEKIKPHCAIYSKLFFRHFDNRFPDVFEGDYTEECLMYQLAALGFVAKVNYRVNMIHDRSHPSGSKPIRSSGGFRVRNLVQNSDAQKYGTRSLLLPYPLWLPSKGVSLYKRVRRHLQAIKIHGWRYFHIRYFSRQALETFCKLDQPTKIAVIMALFYRPKAEYQQYTYSIYCGHSGDSPAQSTIFSALGAAING